MSDSVNIHYLSTEARRALQEALLAKTLRYVAQHSPFYKKLFADQQITFAALENADALRLIPPTTKDMLQRSNWDFLCVAKTDIAEYMATSGTLGAPVTIALTKNDLERLAYNEAQSFALMNIAAEDTVQLMLTLDRQFMAGIAYYSGSQKRQAAVVRTGPGLPELQLEVMQRLKSTVLVAVPSFLLKFIKFAKDKNIDLQRLSVKKVLAIGESIRMDNLSENTLLKRILKDWPIEIFGTYASTEMQSAFTECTAHQGGHLQPELLFVEMLDDEGKAVPEGEIGEITITTLGVEGMPLLRYRTGDLARLYTNPCSCGRSSPRLGPILGRKQQMIKYKGTSIYPPAIMEILNALPFIQEYVVEVAHDELLQDELLIHIYTEMSEVDCNEQLKPLLKAGLRVVPKIRHCSLSDIQKMQFPAASRKQIKFMDRRSAQ